MSSYMVSKTLDYNTFNQFRNVRQVGNRSIGTGVVRIQCGILEKWPNTSFFEN